MEEIEDLEPSMRNKKKIPLPIEANEINEATKVSMRTRIITATIGIVIVLPCIIFGDYLFLALGLFLSIVASYEICRAVKPNPHPCLVAVTATCGALYIVMPIIFDLCTKDLSNYRIFDSYVNLFSSGLVIIVAVLALFATVVLREDFSVKDASFILVMQLLISMGIQAVLFLRYFPCKLNPQTSYFNGYYNAESCALLVFVLLGTYLNDAGAYFVGVFFGKHKMNERISPKKTWEGFVGGIVIGSALTFAFAMIMSANGHSIAPGILDIDHWYFILVLSLVIPVLGVLGDLAFSALKRYLGIKDYGNILPGHGGVLDRIDSVIFTAVMSQVLIYIFALIVNCPVIK